ncbi:MAG: UDP-N-acetylglucosamine 2-epimerase [Flavobacteriales bacterium]|nr:UDP-N-acetylglucosamine 2-epimerase [Flavobacteriales bacterium]
MIPLIQDNDILERSSCKSGSYALMTMHRPATVDDAKELAKMIELIKVAARDRTVVFSVHPRTRTNMERFGIYGELEQIKNLQLHGPMDYFASRNLLHTAR